MQLFKKLVLLTSVASFLSFTSLQAQDEYYYEDGSQGYFDGMNASTLSIALPVAALIIAGIWIATTNGGHHHGSSSGSSAHSGHF